MIAKRFKQLLVAGMMMVGVMAVTAPATGVYAVDPVQGITNGVNGAGGSGTSSTSLNDRLKQIVSILLFALGAIAVIMIVIGGIRYALSGGDQTQITAAKNTILYSVVGLVVAIMAYAIVNWVLGAFN